MMLHKNAYKRNFDNICRQSNRKKRLATDMLLHWSLECDFILPNPKRKKFNSIETNETHVFFIRLWIN